MKKRKTKKRRRMIKPKIQTAFCLISLAFIIGCCIYYGNRLIKYYKIYNPKSETGETLMTLASTITSKSQIVYEGDGLYLDNGNYIYKGSKVDNYVLVNNILFRIIKVNSDRTMDIVFDEYINKLPWNSEYKDYSESSINKYLNEKVLSIFDKEILEPTVVCSPKVSKLTEVKCDEYTNKDYVRLLGISDILNSMVDSKSYLVNDSEYLWLYNETDSKAWHTSGSSFGSSEVTEKYGIKPVITLKNNATLISGDGTKNNPYQITHGGDEIGVGTYLDINDNLYIIYEVGEDYYKIQSDTLLPSTRIFDASTNDYSKSGLKYYLEGDYLREISYDKLLKEVDFDGVTSKVGILNEDDLKFNSKLKGYFINLPVDENITLYNGTIASSKVNIKRSVRPCFGISKDLNIISGNGSILAPFIVEV